MENTAPYHIHRYWPEDDPSWVLVFWFQKIDGKTELVGFEIKSVRTHFGDDSAGDEERNIFLLGGEEGYEDQYPKIEPKPLRATTLKPLRLDDERYRALKDEREFIAPLYEQVYDHDGINAALGYLRDHLHTAIGEKGSDRTIGRPRLYGPEHFELVANLYREAAERGIRRTNVWIAEQMSDALDQNISRKQVERWVYRARHEFHTLGEDE